MLRVLVALLGILGALSPDRMTDVFEAVAVRNPGVCARRRRGRSVIRTEGAVTTLICLVGERPYAWLSNLTGVFGAVVLLFPSLYRRFAGQLLYEDPREVEWKDQFDGRVRLVGAIYVLQAVRSRRARRAVE